MQPDLVNGSAPTTATDFSHQSFALSQTQDSGVVHSKHAHNDNDFDFNGGHITISGAFEPAITSPHTTPSQPKIQGSVVCTPLPTTVSQVSVSLSVRTES
jgi:hypothetical protein